LNDLLTRIERVENKAAFTLVLCLLEQRVENRHVILCRGGEGIYSGWESLGVLFFLLLGAILIVLVNDGMVYRVVDIIDSLLQQFTDVVQKFKPRASWHRAPFV